MKPFKETGETLGFIAEAIAEGIVIVDKSQTIVASNEAANNMFQYEKGELVGQPLNILLPKKYLPRHDTYVDKFMDSREKRFMGAGRDLYGLKKNGDHFPVEVGLNPFDVEEQHFVMALVIDITIRKSQEEAILKLNNELEDRIAKRTEDLKDTVSQLEAEVRLRREAENKIKESLAREIELNELKTKFLSLVSHEFKTPLSGILSSASLLQRYTETEQQEKREKHVKTIMSKVKYLNNIINDFLSIERLETGKVNYQFSRFNLIKVINEVVYDANMLLKDGQKISYPENIDQLVIEFDEKILELILTNLISNAIKYSPEDTTIDLRVSQEDDILKIEVEDQGIGIPAEEQKFIFDRYFRAENVLTQEGTGIGLNIVKSHLENLGGTIKFNSQPAHGSTFTITLPIKPA